MKCYKCSKTSVDKPHFCSYILCGLPRAFVLKLEICCQDWIFTDRCMEPRNKIKINENIHNRKQSKVSRGQKT